MIWAGTTAQVPSRVVVDEFEIKDSYHKAQGVKAGSLATKDNVQVTPHLSESGVPVEASFSLFKIQHRAKMITVGSTINGLLCSSPLAPSPPTYPLTLTSQLPMSISSPISTQSNFDRRREAIDQAVTPIL